MQNVIWAFSDTEQEATAWSFVQTGAGNTITRYGLSCCHCMAWISVSFFEHFISPHFITQLHYSITISVTTGDSWSNCPQLSQHSILIWWVLNTMTRGMAECRLLKTTDIMRINTGINTVLIKFLAAEKGWQWEWMNFHQHKFNIRACSSVRALSHIPTETPPLDFVFNGLPSPNSWVKWMWIRIS